MDGGILVIGSLNMDMTIEMNAIPAIGETVLGRGLTYAPGGKGANQACAAGRLGRDVHMLGCIGRDDFGKILRKSLYDSGVDVSHIKESESNPTGMASIYVGGEGDNNIVVVQGANLECDVAYLKEQDALFQNCQYVLLQMEVPQESIFYAIRRAKELGKTVICNPAPAPDYIPDDIYPLMDYITPNETELLKLAGREKGIVSMEEGACAIREKGVGHVLVTLGEMGCLYAGKEGVHIFKGRRVRAVDTTAAGDCFNGAFAAALAEGKDVEEAINFANMAASITVTKKGAQVSLPLRYEVDALCFTGKEVGR